MFHIKWEVTCDVSFKQVPHVFLLPFSLASLCMFSACLCLDSSFGQSPQQQLTSACPGPCVFYDINPLRSNAVAMAKKCPLQSAVNFVNVIIRILLHPSIVFLVFDDAAAAALSER